VAAVVDVLGTPLRCSCIALPPASLQSKALLLQSWYGLSDPGLEKQLSAKGLHIKTGEVSIVDATVIDAKQRRTTSTSMKTASSKPLNTPPATHTTQSLKKLLTYTEEQVYADLCPRGYKAKRNQPLSEQQKHQNRQWSSVRSTVERVFGVLKRHYDIGKARYLGGAATHNQAQFMLAAVAYNLKRGAAVLAEMMASTGYIRPMDAKRLARAKKL
jgi:IS5 family transposase